MAKKKPTEEVAEVLEEKATLSEQKLPELSFNQYLEVYGIGRVHPYTRAYLREQFRGIMKTEKEWEETVKKDLKPTEGE